MNCDSHCPISSCWPHCAFDALLLGALTWHGCQWTTVMVLCLPWLEAPSLQGRPLEQINIWIIMDRRRCRRTTVTEAPLPVRRSREARLWRASMLVYICMYICNCGFNQQIFAVSAATILHAMVCTLLHANLIPSPLPATIFLTQKVVWYF